jgi:pimeloyl-ACP methyl ester carboxylesterase
MAQKCQCTRSSGSRLRVGLAVLCVLAAAALILRSVQMLVSEVEPNNCSLVPSMVYYLHVPVPLAAADENPWGYRLLRAVDYRSDPKRADTLYGGAPVLFVHGHRGDYMQCANLVGQAAEEWSRVNVEESGHAPLPLDVFTIDMREDSSAFHADIVRVQAAFFNRCVAAILTLYEAHHARAPSSSSSPPRSVLVIAHSMGGVVTRTALTLDSFLPGSVHTLVTVASPVRASPYLGDASVPLLYDQVHRFWASFRPRANTRAERATFSAQLVCERVRVGGKHVVDVVFALYCLIRCTCRSSDPNLSDLLIECMYPDSV